MGFIFNGKHSDEFGIAVTTGGIPYIPPKRQTIIEVNGRDGQYVFEDGYSNITIDLSCAIGDYEMSERRKRARAISSWLSATGILVFDYEPDMEYIVVKSVNNIVASVIAREYRDEFTIQFECKPFQQQTYYNNDLTWDDLSSSWSYSDIPWNGYGRTFVVNLPQTITLENAGTRNAYPVIILSGTAISITIGGFTLTNILGETLYVDCDNKLVYSKNGNTKVNRMSNFTGSFTILKPGTNQIVISNCNSVGLTVEFDYKNTYL